METTLLSFRGLLPLALVVSVQLAHGQPLNGNSNGLKNYPFEFALIGDQPYGPTAGTPPTKIQTYPVQTEYTNLIADINNSKAEFVVHVGDIKAGDTLCLDNVYTSNRDLFNTFSMPAIYLAGDNEWTDCHRANNGGYNPIERLSFLRGIFYTSNQSLGQRTTTLFRQSDDVGPADYKENVMWAWGAVLFVGLNMPGSNNNRNRTTGLFQDGDAEYNARNAANLAWLQRAFDFAASDPTIKGVMILAQANPFERFVEPGQGYTLSGYGDFIKKVRNATISLGRPVVYVNGDTHYFRVDKPLTETYPACSSATPPCVPVAPGGARIEHFTRTEVFGQTDVHWTKVHVDPQNPNLFVFEPMTVQANVKPHPIVP